jgi:hypothetical protein
MAYTGTHQIADDQNQIINPSTEEYQDLMIKLLQLLRPLAIVGSGTGRLQMDVANIPTVAISGTPSVNVTNITSIGGLGGFELQYLTGRNAYATAIRPLITF